MQLVIPSSFSALLGTTHALPSWGWAMVWLAYAIWGLRVSWVDATTRRLPNYYTWPAFILTAFGTVFLPGWRPEQLLGGVLWAGFIVVAPLIHGRMAVGGGDAKLALTLGTLATGGNFWGLWIAMALAGGAGVITAKKKSTSSRDPYLPHGPAMVGGTSVVVVAFIPAGA